MTLKIENLIDGKNKANLIYCVNQGYEIASQLFKNHSFFNFPLGNDHKGNIVRLAVDYSLYKACKHNLLDFEAKIELNARKNCRHIELVNNQAVITTNRTDYYNQIPRDAIFRNQHADNNQMSLFENSLDNNKENGNVYACITHGSVNNDNPEFITFGIPSNDMKSWIDSRNIMNDIHLKTTNKLEPEFDIEEIDLEFKNFVNELKVASYDKK